jgi:hypothetical protein
MRGGVLVLVLASLALLAAGCDGSKSPSIAALTTTAKTSATASAYEQAVVKWADCMRKHGVPNFPNPNSQGATDAVGINVNSPQFLAAHQACQSLEVANPPAVVHQQVLQELAVAQCMRKHGIPDFPDPNSEGRIPQTPTANWRTWTATPLGAKAAKICNPGTG